MNRILMRICFFIILYSSTKGAYEEDLARYKAWPLATASYYDHIDMCIKDILPNSSVRYEKHLVA